MKTLLVTKMDEYIVGGKKDKDIVGAKRDEKIVGCELGHVTKLSPKQETFLHSLALFITFSKLPKLINSLQV
jgi:hypothetical protein